MTDRRAFMGTVAGALLIAPLAVQAQTTPKVWRIGYLRRTAREPADIAAFRLGLRELGYVEAALRGGMRAGIGAIVVLSGPEVGHRPGVRTRHPLMLRSTASRIRAEK